MHNETIINTCETPVLLIRFNRPDITEQQIKALKAVAPKNPWILCDGPRPDKDGELSILGKVFMPDVRFSF